MIRPAQVASKTVATTLLLPGFSPLQLVFRHKILDRNGALHRCHDGGKLQEDAVADGLDDVSAVARRDRIDGGPMFAQSPCRADLIGPHQPGVIRDISRQESC